MELLIAELAVFFTTSELALFDLGCDLALADLVLVGDSALIILGELGSGCKAVHDSGLGSSFFSH